LRDGLIKNCNPRRISRRSFCIIAAPPHPAAEISRTLSAACIAASSSHFDDAMIGNRSGRMTVAQLKQRMDHRFNAVDKRFKSIDQRFKSIDQRFDAVDRRFDSVDRRFDDLNRKLDDILSTLKHHYKHHDRVVDEHDRRLKDLEAWRRTSQNTAR
jgi:septal ring factor EnvC (AmiA/AmiB activator)